MTNETPNDQTVTEQGLFAQFLNSDLIEHTRAGEVYRRTPVQNYLSGYEVHLLDELVEAGMAEATETDSQPSRVIDQLIDELEGAARQLRIVHSEFEAVNGSTS